jgi:GMP synthase (glutamine-hydrolysing)
MGGPQSACELDNDPYLYDEITLIKDAIAQNKKVLGFCLGAQLIGVALGAPAARSPEKEVGVFPIKLTPHASNDPLLAMLPEEFEVIHWHNDMPGLTATSEILAVSAGCPRQIIKYSSRLYGFQCHLEITREGIKDMIKACPNDLRPSLYTQSESELLGEDYSSINAHMIRILDIFAVVR